MRRGEVGREDRRFRPCLRHLDSPLETYSTHPVAMDVVNVNDTLDTRDLISIRIPFPQLSDYSFTPFIFFSIGTLIFSPSMASASLFLSLHSYSVSSYAATSCLLAASIYVSFINHSCLVVYQSTVHDCLQTPFFSLSR